MKVYAKKEARIPFTKEGYEKAVAEKARLMAERPDAVEHLRKAREMGDLSENGYYKAARQRLSALDARLRHFDRLVRLGVIVETKGTGAIDIGNTVVISDGTNTYEYTVVGGYESDPSQKTISHISPIGKALRGKREGESIVVNAPSGVKTYTIVRVS